MIWYECNKRSSRSSSGSRSSSRRDKERHEEVIRRVEKNWKLVTNKCMAVTV